MAHDSLQTQMPLAQAMLPRVKFARPNGQTKPQRQERSLTSLRQGPYIKNLADESSRERTSLEGRREIGVDGMRAEIDMGVKAKTGARGAILLSGCPLQCNNECLKLYRACFLDKYKTMLRPKVAEMGIITPSVKANH